MSRIRMLLADDDRTMFQGLSLYLSHQGFDVVGEAVNGQELVDAAARLAPDLILFDIGMPLLSGLSAAQTIHAANDRITLVVMTMRIEPHLVVQAYELGARGYLHKECDLDEIGLALRLILKGQLYITPFVQEELMGYLTTTTDRRPHLTDRQRQIVQLVAEGHSARDIGARLGITARAIEHHKLVLSRDHDVDTLADYVKLALRHGLTHAQPAHEHTDELY
jgi:DNA-binding NarL/FixJ family response regulator